MRIVVTGATGNVGTALLRALAADERVEEIVGIARRLPDWQNPRTRWVRADVAADPLEPHFAGADAVVHLAWAIAPSHRAADNERVNVGGSRAVLDAVRAAQVPHLVYASSLGTYAPRPPDDARVDEHWPHTGIDGSDYSAQKAAVEQLLDEDEARPSGPLVTRMRPSLVFSRAAASEITRYFVGRPFPAKLLHFRIPIVPIPARWRLQVVHADDVADGYARALLQRAGGAFNLAGEPVLQPDDIARLLGGRHVDVPERLVLEGARWTWHARLQPPSHGWVRMAAQVPLLDAGRAERELGWRATRDSRAAFRELVRGMAEGAGTGSPALRS